MQRRRFLHTAASSVLALTGVAAAASRTPGAASEYYEPLGSVEVRGATEAVVGPDGATAYVATTDGFAVVDLSEPDSPAVIVSRTGLLADRSDGPLSEVLDVKVDGDRLLVAGPANAHDEPSLEGILLYDVSTPPEPERIAFHETTFPIHNTHLDGRYAYLVNGSQVVVVDVDGMPAEVGRWRPSDTNAAWADVSPLLRFAHDIYVQNDRAYVVEWDAGTFILDVSDPANPTAVTRIGGRDPETLAEVPEDDVVNHSLSMPGNHHTVMVNEDASLLVLNKEAWPTDLTEELDVDPLGEVELWDVSDETAPERLATIEAPDSRDPEKAAINTTPHNFDVVGNRLYTSWYDGGVKIHDIGDPANPSLLAWWRAPMEWSFWTAQRATDEFFVASSHSRGEYNNGKGALVTFPNRAGEQPSPPPLTRTPTSETPSPTASTVETQSTTPPATSQPSETGTGRVGDGESNRTPGFGALASVSALALGAWRWRSVD